MKVTVFTKPSGCPQCQITKKHMTKKGVRFEEVVVDEAWVERLQGLGFASVPVVLVDEDDVWTGYSSESIDQLARELTAA